MSDDVPAEGERDDVARSRCTSRLDAHEIARCERGGHARALNVQMGAAVVGDRPSQVLLGIVRRLGLSPEWSLAALVLAAADPLGIARHEDRRSIKDAR